MLHPKGMNFDKDGEKCCLAVNYSPVADMEHTVGVCAERFVVRDYNKSVVEFVAQTHEQLLQFDSVL